MDSSRELSIFDNGGDCVLFNKMLYGIKWDWDPSTEWEWDSAREVCLIVVNLVRR